MAGQTAFTALSARNGYRPGGFSPEIRTGFFREIHRDVVETTGLEPATF